VQELRANAIIEPDPARDLLDVGADFLGKIGHLVDKGDLGREKRVRGVFGQLRAAAIRVKNGRRIEMKRPIDVGNDLARSRVVGPDHYAVGMLEVPDRPRPPSENSGFENGSELRVGILLAHDALDLIGGPDRNVDLVTITVNFDSDVAIFARRRKHIGQIGRARRHGATVFPRR